MSFANPLLKNAALEAVKPRVRCGNKKSCSCNDYPKRMAAFHELAPPQAVLEMFAIIEREKEQNELMEAAVHALRRLIMSMPKEAKDKLDLGPAQDALWSAMQLALEIQLEEHDNGN